MNRTTQFLTGLVVAAITFGTLTLTLGQRHPGQWHGYRHGYAHGHHHHHDCDDDTHDKDHQKDESQNEL